MDYYSSKITALIEELSRLPGIRREIGTAAGVSCGQYAGG